MYRRTGYANGQLTLEGSVEGRPLVAEGTNFSFRPGDDAFVYIGKSRDVNRTQT